ncbi:DUF4129 domain-containing protein [Georgenia faecalis]|uniref:DUF4129 domain-containing protein n=1 Tax=Georgenia faecalis TaxID=2483799 RepID=UPI000FDC92A1|nr:DUF4129 domain-containing protein [Georgenia faecalis]
MSAAGAGTGARARHAGFVLVALVVVLAVLAAGLNGPWRAQLRPAATPTVPTAQSPRTAATAVTDEPRLEVAEVDTGLDPMAIVAVLLLVLAVLLGRWLVVRMTAPPGGASLAHASAPGRTTQEAADVDVEPDLPALRRGADAADALLRSAREPGDAVVAAWLALEDAAASSGVPRDPAQTPTEFTTAVLDATAADPGATRALLRLYHRARFATGDHLTADDLDQARACLRRLAASWQEPA